MKGYNRTFSLESFPNKCTEHDSGISFVAQREDKLKTSRRHGGPLPKRCEGSTGTESCPFKFDKSFTLFIRIEIEIDESEMGNVTS